jgi:hypothetical protein
MNNALTWMLMASLGLMAPRRRFRPAKPRST